MSNYYIEDDDHEYSFLLNGLRIETMECNIPNHFDYTFLFFYTDETGNYWVYSLTKYKVYRDKIKYRINMHSSKDDRDSKYFIDDIPDKFKKAQEKWLNVNTIDDIMIKPPHKNIEGLLVLSRYNTVPGKDFTDMWGRAKSHYSGFMASTIDNPIVFNIKYDSFESEEERLEYIYDKLDIKGVNRNNRDAYNIGVGDNLPLKPLTGVNYGSNNRYVCFSGFNYSEGPFHDSPINIQNIIPNKNPANIPFNCSMLFIFCM